MKGDYDQDWAANRLCVALTGKVSWGSEDSCCLPAPPLGLGHPGDQGAICATLTLRDFQKPGRGKAGWLVPIKEKSSGMHSPMAITPTPPPYLCGSAASFLGLGTFLQPGPLSQGPRGPSCLLPPPGLLCPQRLTQGPSSAPCSPWWTPCGSG